MDDDLRNGLWNALTEFYWKKVKATIYGYNYEKIDVLVKLLWLSYFKEPIDTLNRYWPNTYRNIREYFFSCKWYEVYDFIEFVANNYQYDSVNQDFMNYCNSILERELSGYRFVGGKITPITSKEKISEVEEALNLPIKPVNTHLKRALDLFADRKSPDYRNSIKESISAVEAICKLITKEKKATLGQALKKVESKSKVNLHPALKEALSKLYGYTSDAEGIRHALLDEPNLSSEDAKFMLISCSAFINYLISKASKAGIKI